MNVSNQLIVIELVHTGSLAVARVGRVHQHQDQLCAVRQVVGPGCLVHRRFVALVIPQGHPR